MNSTMNKVVADEDAFRVCSGERMPIRRSVQIAITNLKENNKESIMLLTSV